MKLIDVTIDLETCGLSANAAVMQLAAVAWDRTAEDSQAVINRESFELVVGVDLRTAVMDGFDFDKGTLDFWKKQKDEVKAAVVDCDTHSMQDVMTFFVDWLKEVKKVNGADAICLWAQGSDFDLAIIKNALAKYDLRLPFSHKYFRDSRTFILEIGASELAGRSLSLASENLCDIKSSEAPIYEAVTYGYEMPEVIADMELCHDAQYDARRTAWTTWCALRRLNYKQD